MCRAKGSINIQDPTESNPPIVHPARMEVPVVSFVINRLGDLLIEEGKFLYGVTDQVEQIRLELTRMQCFLEDADARHDGDARFNNCASQIRELAYEAEYIIETFVMKVTGERKGGKWLAKLQGKCLQCKWLAKHRMRSDIEAVRGKITNLTTSLQTYGTNIASVSEGTSSAYRSQQQWRQTYPHVIDEDFIKSADELNMVVKYLVDENPSRLVSICGMGGLGKTTLARKAYNHKDVRSHFDCFAWVCISQQYQIRDILLGMLINLCPGRKDQVLKLRDEELFLELYTVQCNQNCLTVLDDIWSIDAWNSLQPAFPVRIATGSKILLTTRDKMLAPRIDPCHFLLEPRCLNEEESCDLLRRKAYPTAACTDSRDEKMEELGKKMVQRCGGLPLAIIVLGGLLAAKHTSREWEMISESIQMHKRRENHGEYDPVSRVLALSYDALPYQLKPCFLYFSQFPEDFEISAERLCQLWMAEGFLSTDDKGEAETMMDVAEHYLSVLARRCLVQVKVSKSTGRIKQCRVHDLMLELCLSKSKEQNFLRIIHLRCENDVIDGISTCAAKIHRLAIHLSQDVERAVLPGWGPSTQQLRSILFFAPRDCEPSESPPMQLEFYFKNFILLRVLDLEGFNFKDTKIDGIGKLTGLRYLSFKNCGPIQAALPPSLLKFAYLQSFDLQTLFLSGEDIEFQRMESLKHLYIRYSSDIRYRFKLQGLSNLETLEGFETTGCDVSDLCKLLNLRKLKASFSGRDNQDLAAFINYLSVIGVHLRQTFLKVYSDFTSEDAAVLLRQLLGCNHLYKLKICGAIRDLPGHQGFSKNISKLDLEKCLLEEDPMPTLEMLPSLLTLRLSSNAFAGQKIVCSANGFPQLRKLILYRMRWLLEWTVQPGAMPKLLILRIVKCSLLQMVPDGLRFITTLQLFMVKAVSRALKVRLHEKDGQDYEKIRHIPTIQIW